MRVLSLLLLVLLAGPLFAVEQSLDRIAVVVDNSVILESQVHERVLDAIHQLQSNNTPVPPEEVLRDQVIHQMILEQIQLNLAEKAGIRISDDQLNQAMSEMAAQNHLTLQQFQTQLDHTAGTSYAAVRTQVADEMKIQQLRNHEVSARMHITQQEVDAFLASPAGQQALANEYHLAHIFIALPDQPTPEQIQAAQSKADAIEQQLQQGGNFAQLAAANSQADDALQGGDMGWRGAAQIPSLFSESVSHMKVGDISAPLRSDSGFHIVKLLDQHSADHHMVHQIHCRHILIKPSEVQTSAEAQARIEQIAEKLKKGGDFAQLANLYSEDPGSARQGGDLGWVSPGVMIPAFEKVMDATPVGQTSAPFQSQFGWHILKVEGVRDQDMSQSYREELARQALFRRDYDENLQAWLRELRAQAYVDIKTH